MEEVGDNRLLKNIAVVMKYGPVISSRQATCSHFQARASCDNKIDGSALPSLFIFFAESMFPTRGRIFELLQSLVGLESHVALSGTLRPRPRRALPRVCHRYRIYLRV